MLLFDTSGFTASQLTVRANDAVKFPFIETKARRLFNVDTILGHVAQLDRESVGVRLMGSVAAGTTPAARGVTRARNTYPVNAIKIADRLVITPAQIDGVRMTGLQAGETVALESMNSIVDKGLVEKFGDMDHTMEYLCMHAIKGTFRDPSDNSVEVDYVDLFDVTRPSTLFLDLADTAAPLGTLRTGFQVAQNNIRAGLGNIEPTGYVAFYGSAAWILLQAHPELRDAFQRRDDGAFLSSSGLNGVTFAGIEHVEYRGPAVGANEIVIVPVGIPGMLEIRYASGDKLGFTNQPGLPRFVIPKNANDPFQDFGEGAEWEISSRPVVYNLRPEAVQIASALAS